MRRAVRKAAIWASVATPDMMASMAPAASMRVRSRRSTSARTASVMIGLVMTAPPFLQSEIGLLDRRAREECLPRPAQGDPPILQNIGARRQLERLAHVLLHEQDRRPLGVDAP